LQHGERGGRAVDPLPARTALRKAAFEQQLAALAGLEPALREEPVERACVGKMKDRFNRTCVGAGADERFVRPLADEELECSHYDGLAGARFAGHRNETWLQFPSEIAHQREILDSQGGERCEHGPTM